MTQSPLSKRSRALALRNDISPFGNKLIQAGYVDSEQMQKALIECEKTGRHLLDVLQDITSKALSPELQLQYKKQLLFELKIVYGVQPLDPDIEPVSLDTMGNLIELVLKEDICTRYKLLPLDRTGGPENGELLVAMVEPDNLSAQDELKLLLRKENLSLKRRVITAIDYENLFNQYREAEAAKVPVPEQKEINTSIDDIVEDLGDMSLEEAPDDANDDLDSGDVNSAPVIKLVNKILLKAITEGASDIHVEPQEHFLQVRFRKDGVLTKAFDDLPKKIAVAAAARFKIMADLDIAERRMPQDGKIRRMFQGRPVDFRVNTLPCRYGEKICLRILDNSATQLGLDMLITHQPTLDLVRELAARPFGLFLVTGPTGSGKSTSLYSVLAERNSPDINISTAEDPIEYSLPGITQVQVIREKMDFAGILRAFMRQDPDVILVGETRDHETAKTAIEAALTGHLVLTTLHTNDAAGAIARLDEMGIEPFMISGSLLGVLAQRLMRRVCGECRIAYQPTAEELGRYGMSVSGDGELTLYKANHLSPEQIQEAKASGTLCPKCKGSGYKGRVGVYEVMAMSERLEALINQGATTDMIKEAAVEEGMITILAYSLDLVRQGYTTFEEVDRVTFTDSGLEAELKAKRKIGLTCRSCSGELQPDWVDCPYCLTPRFA